MIPWVHLDTAAVPGGGTLKLMQRGAEFAIFAGNVPLMNSRMSSSEIVLAEIACERLKDKRNARLLIGGYGMGFTLRAALAGLPKDAQVVVAELVRTNSLSPKPEQIKTHIEELAASYEKPEDVVRWYYSDMDRLGQVEAVVIENNVTDFIFSKAKVTDKSVSFDELMGQS